MVKGSRQRRDSDGDGIADAIPVKGERGDTLVLDGSGLNDDVNDHRKTRIRVTLQRLSGPIQGFDVPAGRELIGIVVRFENAGRLRYDDAQPQGQLTLRGGEAGQAQQAINRNYEIHAAEQVLLQSPTLRASDPEFASAIRDVTSGIERTGA